MNTILIIVILFSLWLMYSMLESYRNIQKELREIRLKCVSGNVMPSSNTTFMKNMDPVDKMKSNVIKGLTNVLSYYS